MSCGLKVYYADDSKYQELIENVDKKYGDKARQIAEGIGTVLSFSYGLGIVAPTSYRYGKDFQYISTSILKRNFRTFDGRDFEDKTIYIQHPGKQYADVLIPETVYCAYIEDWLVKEIYDYVIEHTTAKRVKISSNKKSSSCYIFDLSASDGKASVGANFESSSNEFVSVEMDVEVNKVVKRTKPFIFIDAYSTLKELCDTSNNFEYNINWGSMYGVRFKTEAKAKGILERLKGEEDTTYYAKLHVKVIGK